MNISQIAGGDVVRCDVKGRVFFAEVTSRPYDGGLDIQPITRESYRHVTATQVKAHYKWTGRVK